MHSDRPFLEAIREQPDDDLHRLAWADWLEERGDDDRSAFLRAQLVAARLDETDLALDALEDHADDLLAAHEDEWAGRVGELAFDLGWSRGCIESVTLSADKLLDYGDELFETMPIRHVRLVAREEDLPRVAECPWLAGVEHLEIANASHLRDAPLQAFLASPYLGRLTSLDLRGHGIEGPLIQTLIGTGILRRLRRLDLSGNKPLGDRATRLLAEANAPNLEWLGLDGTNITSPTVTFSERRALSESLRSGAVTTARPSAPKITATARLTSNVSIPRRGPPVLVAPIMPPSPIDSTTLLGTTISAPFSLSPSYRMFIARRWRAVGLFS